MITVFRGPRWFLSNMAEVRMGAPYEGHLSAESAFQSEKTMDPESREKFKGLNGFEARKLGKQVVLRPDWNESKELVMLEVLRCKFRDPDMRAQLLATGVEGITHYTTNGQGRWWFDPFWGVSEDGKGANYLGILLMQVRDEIRAEVHAQGPEERRLIGEVVVAGTGHRPKRLGNEYNGIGPYSDYIRHKVELGLKWAGATDVITGMALGYDQILAEVALAMRLRVHAYVPGGCDQQTNRWVTDSKRRYRQIIDRCYSVTPVPDRGLYSETLDRRNHEMVKACHILMACYDGTGGGTANCISYALGCGFQWYTNGMVKDKIIISFDPHGWKEK